MSHQEAIGRNAHKIDPNNIPAEPARVTAEGKHKHLGIWIFLGSETVLFASLFGTYIALKNSTAGGPTTQELYGLELVFLMTLLLLWYIGNGTDNLNSLHIRRL